MSLISVATELSTLQHVPAGSFREASCSVLSSRAEILRLQPLLVALSEREGQAGAMDYLDYFLNVPENKDKKPCLVLLSRSARTSSVPSLGNLLGAVMLYEYTMMGKGLKIFTTEDFAGRRTVIGPAEQRPYMVAQAGAFLMGQGAQVVLVSASNELRLEGDGFVQGAATRGRGSLWGVKRRMIPTYLYLKETYDATLLQMGKHTRRNMRYYQRKAETELGCCFVVDAMTTISKEDLLAMNQESTHPVEAEVAAVRLQTLRSLQRSFLVGVQSSNGEWLSLLAGRRHNGMAEIDWQINRAGFEKYSMGTVMRSYFIQDEIRLGTDRIFFEGGTPHSMQQAFAEEEVVDVVVMRRSIFAKLLRRYGRKVLPPKNFLMQILTDSSINWQRR